MRALYATVCEDCHEPIESGDAVEFTPTTKAWIGHQAGGFVHLECPTPSGSCWICGDRWNHDGQPHGEATGDGLTRLDVLSLLAQGGVTWRDG